MQTETKLKRDDPYNPNIATGTIPPGNNGESWKGDSGCFWFLIKAITIAICIYFIVKYLW